MVGGQICQAEDQSNNTDVYENGKRGNGSCIKWLHFKRYDWGLK
jgi:hypothetical protein